MINRHAIATVAVVLLSCWDPRVVRAAAANSPALPPPTTRPTTAPVAAVWYDVGYPPPPKPGEEREPEGKRLIVGVWADGTVVWSDDRARGGKPYYVGRVPGEMVAKLLTSLEAVGLFEIADKVHFGPDASYTVVAAEVDGKRQWLGSWHDPPTTRPLRHVGESGISSLAPAEPRPKHSHGYARFLEVWSESRRLIESVVPERQGRRLEENPDAATFNVGRDGRK